MVGAVAIVLLVVLSLLWLPRSGAQVQASWYPRIVPGEVIERALAADETVTFVYDGRPNMHRLDAGERYMLVEVRCTAWATLAPPCPVCLVRLAGWLVNETDNQLGAQLTYEVDGDQYPDPLLMVAYEAVPFIFYSENQFTTNATYYDQVAFQLVKTYHYVVVDRQGIRPGSWYITSKWGHSLPCVTKSFDWRCGATRTRAALPLFLATARYRAHPARTSGVSHEPAGVEPERSELPSRCHYVGNTPLPESLLKSRHLHGRWQLRLCTWMGRQRLLAHDTTSRARNDAVDTSAGRRMAILLRRAAGRGRNCR